MAPPNCQRLFCFFVFFIVGLNHPRRTSEWSRFTELKETSFIYRRSVSQTLPPAGDAGEASCLCFCSPLESSPFLDEALPLRHDKNSSRDMLIVLVTGRQVLLVFWVQFTDLSATFSSSSNLCCFGRCFSSCKDVPFVLLSSINPHTVE